MRDCLILGSGRSGTSMLGGMLFDAGYHMGDQLHGPGIESNPKGFFESPTINSINEDLLGAFDELTTPYVPAWLRPVSRLAGLNRRYNPRRDQRWLAALPADLAFPPPSADIESRIRAVAARRPFAYKDPRFSYTLPVWEPLIPDDTVYLCIFRSPQVTVTSIRTECSRPDRDYLHDLRMNDAIAYSVWTAIYRSILRLATARPERFVFVHYDQVLDGTVVPRLSRALAADLSGDFADPALSRSRPRSTPPRAAAGLYAELCRRAGC